MKKLLRHFTNTPVAVALAFLLVGAPSAPMADWMPSSGEALAYVPVDPNDANPMPDPDRDGDGIPDDRDICPDRPGDGNPDNNPSGCPFGKSACERHSAGLRWLGKWLFAAGAVVSPFFPIHGRVVAGIGVVFSAAGWAMGYFCRIIPPWD